MNEDEKNAATFHELRGLINELVRQLLASFIHFEDKLMESGEYDGELLQADQQLCCAIETMLKIRDIVIFNSKKYSSCLIYVMAMT